MTALDYVDCPEFKAFSKLWVEEKLPIEFADWLRDRGLDLQADAVILANSIEARGMNRYAYIKDNFGGLRPYFNCQDEYIWGYWNPSVNEERLRSLLDKPIWLKLKTTIRKTPQQSISDYLDAYAESRVNDTADANSQ